MEKIMLKPENKIFKNLYNDHGWEIENAIKRDDWKEEIVVYNEEQYTKHKEYRDNMHANKKDYYRKNSWQKKKYT